MKMTEAADRTPELLGRLLQVWEDSVRATHLFLSDAEIKDIKELYKKWGRMRSRLPIAFNVKIRV